MHIIARFAVAALFAFVPALSWGQDAAVAQTEQSAARATVLSFETEAQLNTMLAHTEVQQVQGYFFSRPVQECDIGALIERMNAKFHPVATNRRHG